MPDNRPAGSGELLPPALRPRPLLFPPPTRGPGSPVPAVKGDGDAGQPPGRLYTKHRPDGHFSYLTAPPGQSSNQSDHPRHDPFPPATPDGVAGGRAPGARASTPAGCVSRWEPPPPRGTTEDGLLRDRGCRGRPAGVAAGRRVEAGGPGGGHLLRGPPAGGRPAVRPLPAAPVGAADLSPAPHRVRAVPRGRGRVGGP